MNRHANFEMADKRVIDYIVVARGRVVVPAHVLASKRRVMLLKQGPVKVDRIREIPASYIKFLVTDTYLVTCKTKPQPQLKGRRPVVPQRKVPSGRTTSALPLTVLDAMLNAPGTCALQAIEAAHMPVTINRNADAGSCRRKQGSGYHSFLIGLGI